MDFDVLADIPLWKRMLFKPSEDAMVYIFHKNLIDEIAKIGSLECSNIISVDDYSLEKMLS